MYAVLVMFIIQIIKGMEIGGSCNCKCNYGILYIYERLGQVLLVFADHDVNVTYGYIYEYIPWRIRDVKKMYELERFENFNFRRYGCVP